MRELTITLFDDRPKVGGERLHPLTGGRIAMLEERGNPLIGGVKEGATVSSWAVYEVLMVARLEDEDLVDVAMEDETGWQRAVKGFALQVPDDELREFWQVLEAEIKAIEAAQVEVKKKPKAGTGRRAKAATRRTGG